MSRACAGFHASQTPCDIILPAPQLRVANYDQHARAFVGGQGGLVQWNAKATDVAKELQLSIGS